MNDICRKEKVILKIDEQKVLDLILIDRNNFCDS